MTIGGKEIVAPKGFTMDKHSKPPDPVYVPCVGKGEEHVIEHGREDGRGSRGSYRAARDFTGVNPDARASLHSARPGIPWA